MRVGVPRERKDGERRVGLLPEGVAVLVASNHEVVIERGAGERVGVDDASYANAGAHVVSDAAEIFGCALIVIDRYLPPCTRRTVTGWSRP